MARPSEIKEPKKFTMVFEQEQYEKLAIRVPNISEWIRNRVDDFVDAENDLEDLKTLERIKKNELEELQEEIRAIREKIEEIETIQKKNAENKETQKQILETLNKVISNEFNGAGITRDRLKAINQNRLTRKDLKTVLDKNNIKIIKPAEIKTSKIIDAPASAGKTAKEKHNTPVIDIKPMEKLVNDFMRKYNFANARNTFSNISKKQYLKENKQVYEARCLNKGVDYNEFEKIVLSD
jgi:TolA-binding protein